MKKSALPRISWIDICRGIGILLVLYGHGLGSDQNRFLIYAFHMPLFFFLSGIVFRPNNKGFISDILKNVRTIMLPYFVFAFLTLVLDMFLVREALYTYESLSKQIYGIFYGSANKGYLAFNTALWFLPCLFVTKIGFSLVTQLIKSKKIIAGLLVALSAIAYGISLTRPDIKLPFGIEVALSGLVFFGAGYLWNQSTKIKELMLNKKLLILGGAAIITILFAWLNFHFYGSQIDMRVNRLNNYFLFYIAAFSGIIACIAGSMLIKKNALLEYIGKHSILLFGWHTLIFTYFKHISFFPPVSLEFLTPTLHLTLATIIILLTRLLLVRLKFDYLLRRTK